MNGPGFLRTVPNGVTLEVKVQPRAPKNEIGEATGDELRIKVTAPPVDLAANEALQGLLAKVLDCPRSTVQLLRGKTSRHKVIFIQGADADTVLEKLRSAKSK